MKKIVLKLINDERKDAKIISTKGCITMEGDFCVRSGDDVCGTVNFGTCTRGAYDYCKYTDDKGCEGHQASLDYCYYDYFSSCVGQDICIIDV